MYRQDRFQKCRDLQYKITLDIRIYRNNLIEKPNSNPPVVDAIVNWDYDLHHTNISDLF